MASKSKRTKAIRKWKEKPNKANLKANIKRIQKNAEILRGLAEKKQRLDFSNDKIKERSP